jgi:outer membrane protein
MFDMKTSLSRALLASAIGAVVFAEAARAEDTSATSPYAFEIGGGAVTRPEYFGSDEYEVTPLPFFAVKRFFAPGLGQYDMEEKNGISFGPSFDFIGERDASMSRDLKGTDDIDWALELGLAVRYRYDWFRGFARVRQGFNGHEGQVADFGADFIATPFDKLDVAIGPRATWGSEDYMQTYFGVSAGEAAAPGSVLREYEADAGFRSVGVAASARYGLTDQLFLNLQAEWNTFVGPAADSPIVEKGSENFFQIGAGLSYRFGFDPGID